MPVIGGVYKFESDQAAGYISRPKFHVYLGPTEHQRAPAKHAFLFISSADYGGCFPIACASYTFLQYDSFISCGKLVYYTGAHLNGMKPPYERVGEISGQDLLQLRNHLAYHDVMVQWEINIACEALKDFTGD